MRKLGLLTLSLLAGGLALGAGILWGWYVLLGAGDLFPRADIEGLAPRDGAGTGERAAEDPGDNDEDGDAQLPELVNVLLAGSDNREGLPHRQNPGERPDTIMVVQMRTDGSDAALLSIPRDLRVEGCDGNTGRINASFAAARSLGREGGSCLVETVTAVTGIPIHHYVEVKMAGFVDLVETIGGVEMCFDDPPRRPRLPAGCHRLDGTDALAYVRDRSADGTGDFGRMRRQQRFLKAVADEVARVEFAANVPRLVRTIGRVKDSVVTDAGLDLRTMRTFGSAFRDIDSDAIVGTTVPADPRMLEGVSYVILRADEAEEIFAAFRDGKGHDYLRNKEQTASQ
jgi:LCP family protein required for cell wall assembly